LYFRSPNIVHTNKKFEINTPLLHYSNNPILHYPTTPFSFSCLSPKSVLYYRPTSQSQLKREIKLTPLPKDKEKRKRIIAAAIKVFALDGLSNGKIATIAQKAGIGKGTVYEYFSSKEDIFEAVFKDFFDQMIIDYSQLLEVPMDPVQKMEAMFDYTYDYLDQLMEEKHGEELLIFLEIFLQGFRDEFRGAGKLSFSTVLREVYDIFKPFVDEGINAGVFKPLDSEHVTFILFAALDGIGLHYFINRNHYNKEKFKTITKDIFLNGLLKSQTEGA